MSQFGLVDQVLACRAWLGDTFAYDALCQRQAQTHPFFEIDSFYPRHRLLRSLNRRLADLKVFGLNDVRPPIKNSCCWRFLKGHNLHNFVYAGEKTNEVRVLFLNMCLSCWYW